MADNQEIQRLKSLVIEKCVFYEDESLETLNSRLMEYELMIKDLQDRFGSLSLKELRKLIDQDDYAYHLNRFNFDRFDVCNKKSKDRELYIAHIIECHISTYRTERWRLKNVKEQNESSMRHEAKLEEIKQHHLQAKETAKIFRDNLDKINNMIADVRKLCDSPDSTKEDFTVLVGLLENKIALYE